MRLGLASWQNIVKAFKKNRDAPLGQPPAAACLCNFIVVESLCNPCEGEA